MPEEVGIILDNLKFVKSTKFGDIELFSGEMTINKSKKILVTTAWSGWGKVSAARATTRLLSAKIKNIPVDFVLFTGVAGAIDKNLKQWDIVIAESVIQHDMDARPLFEKYVIPAIKSKKIYSNPEILDKVFSLLNEKLLNNKLKKFGNVSKGLIATGDQFVSERSKIYKLFKDIDGLLAVEMEGAAFAQVACQENFDWFVMRVISDGADENADDEFSEFIQKYKLQSFELIKLFLESLLS